MAAARSERLFTLRSGGWVLIAAAVVTLAGTVWNLAPLFDSRRVRPRGDGRSTASYDFDLDGALVPKSKIVSCGMVADALPPLIEPKSLTLAQLSGVETVGRGRYLVPSDKVIGVGMGGVARAYPWGV